MIDHRLILAASLVSVAKLARPCLASFLRVLTTSAPLAPAGRGVGGEGWCTQSINCLARGRTSPPGEEKQRCSATRKRPPLTPQPLSPLGRGEPKIVRGGWRLRPPS